MNIPLRALRLGFPCVHRSVSLVGRANAVPSQAFAFLRSIALLLGLLLSVATLAGQTGVVTGEVFDDRTQQALAGARVTLPGTELTTTTDQSGRFRLTGVPAGAHELRVSYLGGESAQARVEIPAGGTRNVALGVTVGVVRMDALVVSSFAGPQIQALNEQRQSDRLSNIISADAVGSLPDQDMRSALSRLPGVNVTGETGEVSIRGAEAKLNAVVMDGGSIAQAASRLDGLGDTGRTRALDLQSIPAESAQSIEVIKTLTPDLDAADVTEAGTGTQRYVRGEFEANGPSLARDHVEKYETVVDGYRFVLNLPHGISASNGGHAVVRVTNPEGSPTKNLEPIMGSFAHGVGFSRNLETVLHVHPHGQEPASNQSRTGPELAFHINPDRSGFHRLYVQVRIDGRDRFAAFGIEVK